MNQNGVIYESGNVIIDISDELEKGNRMTKYLATAGDSFYTCILYDPVKFSWSDHISLITYDGKLRFFEHLVGVPSGLFCDGEFIWYLYNKSKPGQKGKIRKFKISSNDLISDDEIPVIHPVGLFINGENLYTYSNTTGDFVQLKIGEK
jgi:hypothetical protein